LMNVTPTSHIEPSPPWSPRPRPTPSQLAVAQVARNARRTVEPLTSIGEAVRSSRDALDATSERLQAAANSLRPRPLTATDRATLNREIGPNRRCDWTETALERIKALKDATASSVNGVVLAVVAGAIRQFLEEERQFPTDDLEFRVMAP